jgi:hypothetical protein
MNKDAFLQVADAIELADRFDMHSFFTGLNDSQGPSALLHNCDSAGCVGGWTQAVLAPDLDTWESDAGALLGITLEQSSELFYMDKSYYGKPGGVWAKYLEDPTDWTNIKASVVAQMLRDIANGVVEL